MNGLEIARRLMGVVKRGLIEVVRVSHKGATAVFSFITLYKRENLPQTTR